MNGGSERGFRLSFESGLDSPTDVVWRTVSDMDGVNAELKPWFRMTFPAGGGELRPDNTVVANGFRSWLLFGGFLPIDRHSFGFDRLLDLGFVEESSSWMNRRWRHERSVVAVDGQHCVVRDALLVEPRLRWTAPVGRLGVRAVFSHRHRRLRRRFGSAPYRSG